MEFLAGVVCGVIGTLIYSKRTEVKAWLVKMREKWIK